MIESGKARGPVMSGPGADKPKVSSVAERYFLYALGEILLVIIGILFALQINNWNTEVEKQDQINEYLESLTNALNDDIGYLKNAYIKCAFRVDCMQYILDMAEVEKMNLWGESIKYDPDYSEIWEGNMPDSFNRDLTELCFLWSERGSVIVINRSVIEEFKNTGLFSSIRNKDLKNKINTYYGNIEWMFSDWRETNFREELDEWQDFLRHQHGVNNFDLGEVDDLIGLVKDNKDIAVEMKELMWDAIFKGNGAYDNKMAAEELIREINMEIAE